MQTTLYVNHHTVTRLKVMALATFSVFAFAFAAPGAHAACGQFSGANMGGIKLPAIAALTAPAAAEDREASNEAGRDSIVGLWQTIYTAGGATFAQTLKQWHSDGTEFENVAHDPEIGNICFGVWKQVGVRSVRLHHVGWLFDTTGTLTGSFTMDETDTIAPNGMSYKGMFVFKTYNTDGGYSGTTVEGTIAATRITVD
jgi:hypothetical protein